jgi:hypothetical protein
MAQLFTPASNTLGRISVYGLPFVVVGAGLFLSVFYRSTYVTGQNEVPEQPIPFSHLHHAGQLGIDCRYCHTSVEQSSFAGIPPTKTCMNCHQQMWASADLLTPARESYRTDKSIPWQRVHNLPDYVYFNHSIHVAKGVGCKSCHGRLDEMHLTYQTKTLLMEWCLNCHRAPENHLRPQGEVFSMLWTPEQPTKNPETGELYPTNQRELGLLLKQQYHVRDSTVLTSCSTCHR